MAIDPYIFYRAGFARQSTGRNTEVEARIARQERIVDFAYDILGTVAVDSVTNTIKGMKRFKHLADSQMSSANLQLDKLPKENAALQQSILDIKKNYDKANRKAHLNISSKKRSAARQERNKWMTQLQNLNGALELYQTGAKDAQGMIKVSTSIAGEENNAGNVAISPASDAFRTENTTEQANGDMGQLLRWNMDKGQMEVLRGGTWGEGAN